MTDSNLTCERCGMSIPADAKACPNCGAPAPGVEQTEAAGIKTEWTGPEEPLAPPETPVTPEEPFVPVEPVEPEPYKAATEKVAPKEPVYEIPSIPPAPSAPFSSIPPAPPKTPLTKNRNLLYGIGGCCLVLVVLACIAVVLTLVLVF